MYQSIEFNKEDQKLIFTKKAMRAMINHDNIVIKYFKNEIVNFVVIQDILKVIVRNGSFKNEDLEDPIKLIKNNLNLFELENEKELNFYTFFDLSNQDFDFLKEIYNNF